MTAKFRYFGLLFYVPKYNFDFLERYLIYFSLPPCESNDYQSIYFDFFLHPELGA